MSSQPNENALYVVKKSPYGNVEQLVLHVTDKFREGYLCFDDTNRGHMLQGEITAWNEQAFSFADKEKRLWEFEEVTIEEFKSKLCLLVSNGDEIAKKCATTKDLWKYYNELFPV